MLAKAKNLTYSSTVAWFLSFFMQLVNWVFEAAFLIYYYFFNCLHIR